MKPIFKNILMPNFLFHESTNMRVDVSLMTREETENFLAQYREDFLAHQAKRAKSTSRNVLQMGV